ncbi:MAG TPA: glycosidase, partial [Opitutaceae bacterium]|nr:glycosidase [Opitutaceae bacterium]
MKKKTTTKAKTAAKKKPSAPAAAQRAFAARVKKVRAAHEAFLKRKNPVETDWENGVYERFKYPVLTAHHVPLEWRYDFNPKTNPFFMERLGVGGAYNPGAFYWKGKA